MYLAPNELHEVCVSRLPFEEVGAVRGDIDPVPRGVFDELSEVGQGKNVRVPWAVPVFPANLVQQSFREARINVRPKVELQGQGPEAELGWRSAERQAPPGSGLAMIPSGFFNTLGGL